jgi:hypothetical protein
MFSEYNFLFTVTLNIIINFVPLDDFHIEACHIFLYILYNNFRRQEFFFHSFN